MTQPATDREMEKLIEVASGLKQGIEALYDAYGLFPPIIDREHRAIASSDFQTIKSSCEEKETAGAKVESCFEALIRAGAMLGQYRERFCAQPANRPATLSACVETLAEIAAAVGEETAGGKVLHHLLRGTRELVQRFQARYREVKPLIDANKHVVDTVLRNIRASYAFWLEECEKQALGYNSEGAQKATGRNSGFRITA